MVKNSARFMLLAATAVMAVTPVAVAASPSPSPTPTPSPSPTPKLDTPDTRTQGGANLAQREIQTQRSLDRGYGASPLNNIRLFLLALTFAASARD